jgi:hypothetical protein
MLNLFQDRDQDPRPTTWSNLATSIDPSSTPLDSPPSTEFIINLATKLFDSSNKDISLYAEPFFTLVHELLENGFSVGAVGLEVSVEEEFLFSTDALSSGVNQVDQEIWDLLLHSPESISIEPADVGLCREIFNLCWRQDWKLRIESPSIYTLIVKNVIYCALLVPDLQEQAYKYFSGILSGLSSLAEIHIPISVDFLIIEGLGIISNKYVIYALTASKTLQSKIYDDLLSTLTTPSPAFTDLSVFDKDQLRQCLGLVLTTACTNINNYVLTKSTLFSLISASQDTSPDIMRNAFTSIACITVILNPRDVIEIVLSALARRLGDDGCEELVWETLGNIALVTGDVGVFEEVLVVMLEKSQGRVSRITRTLARVRGRPPIFRDVYLSKIICLVIEKAGDGIANLNVSEWVNR